MTSNKPHSQPSFWIEVSMWKQYRGICSMVSAISRLFLLLDAQYVDKKAESENTIKQPWGRNFPSGAVVKNPPANIGDTRDTGSILGLGRSPTLGNGNPLQYSYLENFTEKPGGLQSMGHKELDMTEHARACAHTHTHTHTTLREGPRESWNSLLWISCMDEQMP